MYNLLEVALCDIIYKNATQGVRKVDKRLYSIWHNMKSRCYNENVWNYKYYGGKGIVVCDERLQ